MEQTPREAPREAPAKSADSLAERLHEYVGRKHGITVAPHGAQRSQEDHSQGKRTRNVLITAVGAFILSAAALAAAATWFVIRPADSSGQQQEVVIEPGTPLILIIEDLERRGIIRSSWAFTLLLRFQDRADDVKAGAFALSPAMSPRQIADVLTAQAPPERDVQVMIPEGFSVYQIADRLASSGVVSDADALRMQTVRVPSYDFLQTCAPAAGSATCEVRFADLEGYLFPDTYRFQRKTGADAIARKFLENFNTKFSPAFRQEATEAGRSIRDIVVLASLVEEEAKLDADRGMIAGVLAKRLDIGMALQVDATVLYARERGEREGSSSPAGDGGQGETNGDRVLTLQDLELDSPYNTYKVMGLPPGPIANPGLQSLLAALRPEPSPYLYYLHTSEGETIFSRTLDEHNAAKARYLR